MLMTISSRLDSVLPQDTDMNGQESEADAAQNHPIHAQVMMSFSNLIRRHGHHPLDRRTIYIPCLFIVCYNIVIIKSLPLVV